MPSSAARYSLDEMTMVVRHRWKDLSAKQPSLAEKLALCKSRRPRSRRAPWPWSVATTRLKASSQPSNGSCASRISSRASPIPKGHELERACHPKAAQAPGDRHGHASARDVYRQARVHALGHSPKDFFNKEKDSAWLKV